jgi:hypothetical protein
MITGDHPLTAMASRTNQPAPRVSGRTRPDVGRRLARDVERIGVYAPPRR